MNDFNITSMPVLSRGLYALQNNDMLKAAGVDFFCTDAQRTMLEYRNRGKNAAIEMGFREYTGTFIVEFSSTLFALLTSKIASKHYKPNISVNSSSWITNRGLDVFDEIYQKSNKTPYGFIKDSLNSISALAGSETKKFSDIDAQKQNQVVNSFIELSKVKNNKKQYKNALKDIQNQITELLKADSKIKIKSGSKEVNSNLSHTVRDIQDALENIFFANTKNEPNEILAKLKTINKAKTALGILLAMGLAMSNQYINRKLTKKRTGIDNFVGENDYTKNVETKNQTKKEKGLLFKKILSAGVFTGMLMGVMGVKKPADLINKLEFNGPATSGSAIKTIYGTLILGRIFASKDSTELRETNTRDYLGFLNWLVLGDFVSKGVGKMLDSKESQLFNISKQGNGIKHFLHDIDLKSQKEIIVQGKNVKQNLKHLNISRIAGIGYSALMLGFLLPKFNILMTKRNKKESKNIPFKSLDINDFLKNARQSKYQTRI